MRNRIRPAAICNTRTGMAKLSSTCWPSAAAIVTAATENRKARVARRRRKTRSQSLVAAAKGPSSLIGPSIKNSRAKIMPHVIGRLVASTPVLCAAAANGASVKTTTAIRRPVLLSDFFVGVALCIDQDQLQGLRVSLLAAFCCTAWVSFWPRACENALFEVIRAVRFTAVVRGHL